MKQFRFLTAGPYGDKKEKRGISAFHISGPTELPKRSRDRSPWFRLSPLILQCLAVAVMLFCGTLFSPALVEGYTLEGRHTALSMRMLAEKARGASYVGAPLNDEIARLSGITYLEGYVVDKENQDIILIGKSDRGTEIYLDDLIANIRSIWNVHIPPYCSLDPQSSDISGIRRIAADNKSPESLDEWRDLVEQIKNQWGPQSVDVRGVPRNSRLAHIMIDADYHMKKVSLGLADFVGIPSYLTRNISMRKDALRSGEEPTGSSISMVRFWFHVRQEFPTFGEEEGIVFLKECPMDVLTEKQSINAGKLSDSEQDDPLAQAFAGEFSSMLDTSSENVESYAQLKNLFRIKAVLEAMKYRSVSAEAGLNMSSYCSEYAYQAETPMPDSFPGLVNQEEVHLNVQKEGEEYEASFIPVTWGGVNMEMGVKEKNFNTDKRLKRIRKTIIDARPSPKSLSWTFFSN